MDRSNDRLMTPTEIATEFRVSSKTVLRWRSDKRITGIKTPGGRYRFWESDVRKLLEGDEVYFLLWSNRHEAWLRPLELGYTRNRAEAGRYGQRDAVRIVLKSAMSGEVSEVTCMVAAPAPN